MGRGPSHGALPHTVLDAAPIGVVGTMAQHAASHRAHVLAPLAHVWGPPSVISTSQQHTAARSHSGKGNSGRTNVQPLAGAAGGPGESPVGGGLVWPACVSLEHVADSCGPLLACTGFSWGLWPPGTCGRACWSTAADARIQMAIEVGSHASNARTTMAGSVQASDKQSDNVQRSSRRPTTAACGGVAAATGTCGSRGQPRQEAEHDVAT
jgi:hypothetical protein